MLSIFVNRIIILLNGYGTTKTIFFESEGNIFLFKVKCPKLGHEYFYFGGSDRIVRMQQSCTITIRSRKPLVCYARLHFVCLADSYANLRFLSANPIQKQNDRKGRLIFGGSDRTRTDTPCRT